MTVSGKDERADLPEVLILGRNHIGIVAESEGFRYYLTDCCHASAKGLEDCTGCRCCYEEIDSLLGGLPEWEQPMLTEVFGDGISPDRLDELHPRTSTHCTHRR